MSFSSDKVIFVSTRQEGRGQLRSQIWIHEAKIVNNNNGTQGVELSTV